MLVYRVENPIKGNVAGYVSTGAGSIHHGS